jgi:DNA-binding NarL/FixJ family response regulator
MADRSASAHVVPMHPEREMDDIRVLVVGQGPGLTRDLLLALRRRSGFQLIGSVADAVAATEVLSAERVDIVVVDLDRADGRGIAVVSGIKDASEIRVMAATRRLASPDIELALAAGACGVLPVDRDPAHLVSAFRRALAGELVLPADELPSLVDRLWQVRARRTERALLATLTGREREILTALADGATTVEIAHALAISPATVQTHVKNVLGKLGVHSKVEAVGAAWRAGLALSSRSA